MISHLFLHPNNHQRGWCLKGSVQETLHQMKLNVKEDCTHDYCNRGERLNAISLKQKLEKFLSIAMSEKVLEGINGEIFVAWP